MADAPSLASLDHLKDGDQLHALQTIARMYNTFVKRDIGMPEIAMPTGKVYEGLDETVTDKKAVHALGRRFELDGDELNQANKVRVTGTSVPGQKRYTFYVMKDGQEDIYATATTSEIKGGKKAGDEDTKGVAWNLALFSKNSIRFGFEPENDSEKRRTKRITLERSVSERGEPGPAQLVSELRSKATDWSWQRGVIHDYGYMERYLGEMERMQKGKEPKPEKTGMASPASMPQGKPPLPSLMDSAREEVLDILTGNAPYASEFNRLPGLSAPVQKKRSA